MWIWGWVLHNVFVRRAWMAPRSPTVGRAHLAHYVIPCVWGHPLSYPPGYQGSYPARRRVSPTSLGLMGLPLGSRSTSLGAPDSHD